MGFFFHRAMGRYPPRAVSSLLIIAHALAWWKVGILARFGVLTKVDVRVRVGAAEVEIAAKVEVVVKVGVLASVAVGVKVWVPLSIIKLTRRPPDLVAVTGLKETVVRFCDFSSCNVLLALKLPKLVP